MNTRHYQATMVAWYGAGQGSETVFTTLSGSRSTTSHLVSLSLCIPYSGLSWAGCRRNLSLLLIRLSVSCNLSVTVSQSPPLTPELASSSAPALR